MVHGRFAVRANGHPDAKSNSSFAEPDSSARADSVTDELQCSRLRCHLQGLVPSGEHCCMAKAEKVR